MSLLEQIRSDSLDARRARDPFAANLSTLYAEVARVGKDAGNRDTTDDEAQAVIKKFVKGCDEMLQHLDGDIRESTLKEKTLYEKYLPRQLSRDDLTFSIRAIESDGTEITVKNTGQIMRVLNTLFPGQIDGKTVSEIIRSWNVRV